MLSLDEWFESFLISQNRKRIGFLILKLVLRSGVNRSLARTCLELLKSDISLGEEPRRIPVHRDEKFPPLPSSFAYTPFPKASVNIGGCYPSCTCSGSSCTSKHSSCSCFLRSLPMNESKKEEEGKGKGDELPESEGQEKKQDLSKERKTGQPPLYECTPSCRCSLDCSLRYSGDRLIHCSVEVFFTRDRGWGLRTLEEIKAGTFVAAYVGEILSLKEAQRRWDSMQSKNYIYVLKEHYGASNQKETRTYRTIIDPRKFGNAARFINHSCDPNLILHPIRGDSVVPSLSLFAKRNISPFDELTMSYHPSEGEEIQSEGSKCEVEINTDSKAAQKRSFEDPTRRTQCRCGASCCQGFLPFDPF